LFEAIDVRHLGDAGITLLSAAVGVVTFRHLGDAGITLLSAAVGVATFRHLGNAGTTPRCPEVYQHNRTAMG
jgi:hypothetical protein